MPNKIVSLWRSKFFKMALLILLFVAAALIIMAMLLGQQAGQFVIRAQSGDISKSIAVTTELNNKETYQPSLTVDGMEEMNDYSPEYFLQADYQTLRTLSSKPGKTNYDNNSLYIYTFYIINTSKSGGVGVNVTLNYSNVTKHLDEIVRILTYYETYNVSDPQVYQKPDSLERAQHISDELHKDDAEKPVITSIDYPRYILTPNPFVDSANTSQGTVFNNQQINIGYGDGMDYVKYTIMFWLEGDDPDSTFWGTELFSGTIKFDMTIAVSM